MTGPTTCDICGAIWQPDLAVDRLDVIEEPTGTIALCADGDRCDERARVRQGLDRLVAHARHRYPVAA